MEVKRKKFQGVLNILSFNRHFYVFGFVFLGLICLYSIFLNWTSTLFLVVVSGFIYGLVMPLVVSTYVYDFSGFYDFKWLEKFGFSDSSENKIININAGFDETSFIIKNMFPKSSLEVFDFYDSKKHTESAIVRARKVSLIYPNTQKITSNNIPLKDKSIDVIFLLSAAHEIRNQNEKIQFLKECNRVCKASGCVIMVEHLRDFPNFIAFTIGFTHFFSRNIWKKAFKEAGFSTFEEQKFTPFISIFKSKS